MSKFLYKLERKIGKYAIKNLTVYLLASYAIGYLTSWLSPELYSFFSLSPALVMKGQVWRIFTWIFSVPQGFSIFIIFMFMFQYYIGTALENCWGSFRYNCYIFSGIFFMTLCSMVTYWITGINTSPSTYYINMASFLAFAVCFPDMQVLFMFIIPIKIKWLAIVDLIYMGYEFISVGLIPTTLGNITLSKLKTLIEAGSINADMSIYYAYRQMIWATRICIIVSILNFIIFYFATRNYKRISPKEVKRKVIYKKEIKVSTGQPKHKCAICGRTEKDDDELTFRYCSKCNGNFEFCQEHLYTHKHFE